MGKDDQFHHFALACLGYGVPFTQMSACCWASQLVGAGDSQVVYCLVEGDQVELRTPLPLARGGQGVGVDGCKGGAGKHDWIVVDGECVWYRSMAVLESQEQFLDLYCRHVSGIVAYGEARAGEARL